MGTVKSGLCLVTIFTISTICLYLISNNAPQISHPAKKEFSFPSNLEDLKALANLLRLYYQEHWLYVCFLFSSAYIYKQTFMIPGSVFLNVLGGALFGVYAALVLCSILTGIGATCSYFLSKNFGRSIVERFWMTKMTHLRSKVLQNENNLFYYLLFLRLFPMTPNWLVNLMSPLVGIPLNVFFPTVIIGLIPYNYTCVQAGDMIASLTSMDHVFSLSTFLTLATMAFIALAPTIYFNKYKKFT